MLPPGPDLDSRQRALIQTLASPDYFGTNPNKGTSPGEVLGGMERYLSALGYKKRKLEFRGWRPHPSRYGKGTSRPEMNWLAERLRSDSAVWLNFGWYQNDSADFARTGGHWVTAVGFGIDSSGTPCETCLVVHDPSPREGEKPSNQYVKLVEIENGILKGKNKGLPVEGRGFYRVLEGLKLPRKVTTAVLDSVVTLDLIL